MIIFEIAICTKFDFEMIFINFDHLTVVPSDSMCIIYSMLPSGCFDVSKRPRGCQTMMSLTDNAVISKLDICQTKLPTSQYVPRTSETDIRK